MTAATTRRRVGIVPAALLLLLAAAAPAHAMSCWKPTPEEHIMAAPIIFFGKPRGAIPGANRKGEPVAVEFDVIRGYKGLDGRRSIRVRFVNDNGASVGWGFRPGVPVLVFARPDDPQVPALPSDAALTYCDMIPYHARLDLHPEYWDHLAELK